LVAAELIVLAERPRSRSLLCSVVYRDGLREPETAISPDK
jgi:hypothetical protein